MALTPFTRELGTTQGRIVPSGGPAPEGDYLFCLGSDRAGQVVRLTDQSKIAIQQSDTFISTALLRARLRLRAPKVAPPSGRWRARAIISTDVVADLTVDETREFADIAGHIGIGGGVHAVTFELFLDGATDDEFELPAFSVDALTFDTTGARPLLANRIPEPDATDVSKSTLIALELMDTSFLLDTTYASTKVYVNGELAIDNGAFQPGWNGPGSAVSNRDAGGTIRVVIDPTADFASEQVVTVRVVSSTTDAVTIDKTYSFIVEDFTAPQVASAIAVDDSRIRVTFDETVLASDPAGASDALNPTNWAVTALSVPAVWATVTSVVPAGPSAVEITTDIALTAGAPYRATALNVQDVFGNAVAAPFNSATFVAFGEQAAGRNFEIIKLLPPANEEQDESGDYRLFMAVFQEVTNLLLRRIDRWTEIFDVDLAAEHFVDAILQDLGNPFDFELTLLEKRKLGRLLIPIYRSKGTARGIKNVILTFLGIQVELRYPYFAGARLGTAKLGPGGTFILAGTPYDAYSYEIVAPRALTDMERTRMRELATYMQVAHEHLVRIVEPAGPPETPNHLVLGISQLNLTWRLH